MRHSKNIIVPLSTLIKFNEHIFKETMMSLRKIETIPYHDAYFIARYFMHYYLTARLLFNPVENTLEEVRAAGVQEEKAAYAQLIEKQLSSPYRMQYNRGAINTEQFFDQLFNALTLSSDDKQTQIDKDSLKHAWNSAIELSENAANKLNYLIDQANHDQRIYLVGDSDPLYAEKILVLFKQASPINWKFPKDTAKNQSIKIARNIYLCLSYTYGESIQPSSSHSISSLFKTPRSSLISKVIYSLQSKNILFVNDDEKEKIIVKNSNMIFMSETNFYNQLEPNSANETASSVSSKTRFTH